MNFIYCTVTFSKKKNHSSSIVIKIFLHSRHFYNAQRPRKEICSEISSDNDETCDNLFKLIYKITDSPPIIADQMAQWLGKPAAVPEVPGSNTG